MAQETLLLRLLLLSLCLLSGRHAGISATGAVETFAIGKPGSMDGWRLGGERVGYSLGRSALTLARTATQADSPDLLRLDCDFGEPGRSYVSACYTGAPIQGACRMFRVPVLADVAGCAVRLTVEDAAGRWFERECGSTDAGGRRTWEVPVGSGAEWRPLLRTGQKPARLRHPIALRQIAVHRPAEVERPHVVVHIGPINAVCEVRDVDRLDGVIETGRPGGVFVGREPVDLVLRLRNRARSPVTGECSATVTGYGSTPVTVNIGHVGIPVGATRSLRFRCPAPLLGPYAVVATLRGGTGERRWVGRFARVAAPGGGARDRTLRLGCSGNVEGFAASRSGNVEALNRGAGFGWTRIGLSWSQANPAPGSWAWDPPSRTPGPLGQALSPRGRTFTARHAADISLRDEVTIAFWARADGSNGEWQTPIQKWSPGQSRNYGVYFHRDTGRFCFSAGYEKKPNSLMDFDSGMSAWDGKWHHYAATYSRHIRAVSLYVDGVARTTVDHDGGRLLTNTADLLVASGCPANLDEILIYARALGPADVAALARRATAPVDGLRARWTFDNAAAPLADAVRGPRGALAPQEPDAVRVARAAARQGMKTLAILGFPPPWASSAPASARPWVAAPELKAWAAYVEGVTRQYRGLIDHWEIWNEPNEPAFWEPEPDPERYLAVLKVAYEAAKLGNPRCTVLMPGLSGPRQGRGGMAYLDRLLKLGASRYCDAISIHPYRQDAPEKSGWIEDLRHIAEAAGAGGRRRPIWITENCWTTELPNGSDEERQAEMLARSYVLALGSGLVDALFWFRLHDSGSDRFYTEDNYGLCHEDLSPKPAYFAHAAVAEELAGAWRPKEMKLGDGPTGYAFDTPRGRVAALWSPDGPAWVALWVSKTSARVTNLMGSSRPVAAPRNVLLLRLDEAMQYVRGLPEATVGGRLVTAERLTIRPGARRNVVVALRNPYGTPQRIPISVRVDAPLICSLAPLDEAPESRAVVRDVPKQGRVSLPIDVMAPAKAAPGVYQLTVEATYPGGTIRQPIDVEVTGPDASHER